MTTIAQPVSSEEMHRIIERHKQRSAYLLLRREYLLARSTFSEAELEKERDGPHT